MNPTPGFSTPAALAELEAMSPAELDALPFGVVRMRPDGVVAAYNTSESSITGLSPERVIGRHFFSDVAPCTNNFMVAQRFEDEASLDAVIDYVFTLRMKPTPVKLRLLRSPGAPHMYLLVNRRT